MDPRLTWQGVSAFTGSGHFETAIASQPENLPTGSSTMTVTVGAKWNGPPPSGSGNPMLVKFGNGSSSGFVFQELPVSQRMAWGIGNTSLITSHSMTASQNYTFTSTIVGGLVSFYLNARLMLTSSGRTYTPAPTASQALTFGGSTSGLVPARNWTINFISVAGDTALTEAEVSAWNDLVRDTGPQPLPSASHFWTASDIHTRDFDNFVVSSHWVDRVQGCAIERLSGSGLLLETYERVIT